MCYPCSRKPSSFGVPLALPEDRKETRDNFAEAIPVLIEIFSADEQRRVEVGLLAPDDYVALQTRSLSGAAIASIILFKTKYDGLEFVSSKSISEAILPLPLNGQASAQDAFAVSLLRLRSPLSGKESAQL
jgi:hypothetical protein